MACTNCSKTVTITTNCTSGCKSTINADCVIYDGEPLSFESDSVDNGDKRVLSDLLALIGQSKCPDVTSKVVQFSTDGVSSYTVTTDDLCKTILLTQWDDGVVGTITNTIILPQTTDFIDKELVFKDIAVPVDPDNADVEFIFNIAIQYQWFPTTATSTAMADLMDPTHRTLRLRFVNVNPDSYAASYQWIVVP